MEAMILAAGLGTRLRPLTHDVPKALVEVAGVPMLERVARRLVDAGARRLVINVSPHADMIRDFVAARDGFGVEVRISEEPDGPLETGGGLRKAGPLFEADGPIVVHNVDLITDLDVAALVASHDPTAIATLAVRRPETDRYLLFDERGLLGYAYGGEEHTVREPEGAVLHRDFCGVQAISPGIFDRFEKEERFSIIDTYMRVTREGGTVAAHDVGDVLWIDIGTHERLEEANRALGAA